ncbi:MAG: citrate synthase [Chloroflexi bacterium]|nr:citrate synthase [Chloroflexota bacterium]
MAPDSLSITDNRTGNHYEVPINQGSVTGAALRQIRASEDDLGLLVYDPSLANTITVSSAITYIDGDRGILLYRGYPIEQLAEKASYLEVAYLLVHGELPTPVEYKAWVSDITYRTMVLEDVKKFMDGFRHDSHPMGMLLSTVGALSTYYPESKNISDPEVRRIQTNRAIGKIATIAAFCYRRILGYPYIYPDNELSYTGNLLAMLFRMVEPRYIPNPAIERALEVLFILHADHEQNASTNTMRAIASSQADPYSALAGAIGALYGPLHGGANEAVIRMLKEIGTVRAIPAFIQSVKSGEGGRLMGFGHRIYKNYDPRARIIKEMADQVFKVTGINPLLEVALELERIALQDEYFIQRRLYPNVDFYSGLIYQAMGFPVEMFPVLFAIPRTSGWMAQWNEAVQDPEQRITRPRQNYTGHARRDYPG